LDQIKPQSSEAEASAQVVTTSGSVTNDYFSVSFTTSADFVGTIFNAVINPNTTINLTAEPGSILINLNYTISVGSITIIKLIRA